MKTQQQFGAILICIFFYVQNEFPSFGKISWKENRSIIAQVNEYIERKDSFEAKEAAALRKQDYKGRYS